MGRNKAAVQQCPICKAQHKLETARCDQCGATLAGIPLVEARPKVAAPAASPSASLSTASQITPSSRAQTDKAKTQTVAKIHRPIRRAARLDGPIAAAWDEGEADLHEALLPQPPLRGVLMMSLVIVGMAVGLFALTRISDASATPDNFDPVGESAGFENAGLVTQAGSGALVTRRVPPPTNTRFALALVPTLAYATVTPQPPTATITPTRGPCLQEAKQGDTLFGMAARCGHRDMAIVGEVLRINNMSSPNQLQIGQSLEIPWPTPTDGAPDEPDAAPTVQGDSELAMEPTLPPNLMWYTVKLGDTASSVIYERSINIKILKDLNPEMNFEGCDFGLPTGGNDCSVPLFEGQRLRVPAPPPTPTVSPTPNGSETPTPTITPTSNAPLSQSPSDNMLFEAFELPTLRWVAAGLLQPQEVYLLTVVDQTVSTTYYGTSRELAFQLPAEWQPADGKRHVFSWTITIATLKDGTTAIPSSISSETRTFTWQSR